MHIHREDMMKVCSGRWSLTRGQFHLLFCLILVALSLSVFWNVQFHDFVFYDDPLYVTLNRHVQDGLTIKGCFWALTTMDASNWHPLTWLSLMLDYDLFRLNPAGYHWTNLIIHIANVILLFTVLNRMTGNIGRSAFVTALFAVHPLHVESVAWISERKDVLSTFFWLLVIWVYVRHIERPGAKTFFLLIVSFVLGLLSKPMLVTLPFVLILLDIWPLKRISVPFLCNGKTSGVDRERWRGWQQVLIEKLPLFFLSFLSCVLTWLAQVNGKSLGSLEAFPMDIRIANVLNSYIQYILKVFWPSDLAFFYPYVMSLSPWHVTGEALMLAGITILTIRWAEKRPYLAVGWFWYLGTLIPVIGIVQVGIQSMADRYTYIPLIGLFIMIAWGVPELLGSRRSGKLFLPVLSLLILSILSVCAWQQVQYWKNSTTLFQRALAVTSKNYLAHNNFGVILYRAGRIEEAVRHFIAALQIKPTYADVHCNLGMALVANGNYHEAIRHYREALRIKPYSADIHKDIGTLLTTKGKVKEAIDHYSTALRINPDDELARVKLLALTGQIRKQQQTVTPGNEAIHPALRGSADRSGRK